jgi:hypothetical protein
LSWSTCSGGGVEVVRCDGELPGGWCDTAGGPYLLQS